MKLGGIATTITALTALTGAAYAQPPYPSKPVRVVIPYAPGGGVDIVGRLVGAKLAEEFKQQFIADNRMGGGGTVGNDIVAKASADGYTLLAMNSALTYLPALYPKAPYDTLRDFAPITLIGATPSVLVVNPAVPAKSVKELIALMKAKPGHLNYAAGVGGTLHLAVALFEDMARVKGTLIPYKGGGPALIDTVGGQVQMMIVPVVSAIGHIKSNRLRALGVSGVRRTPMLPEVPPIADSGVPGYEYITWYGMLAPAATPRPILAKLNQSIAKALAGAELRDRFAQQGVEVEASTPEQFSALLQKEIPRWAQIIKAAKIQGE
jgi:tripartite-type tricarboxylate transporter receptor subunit TctC